jgi:hypothetical protein
LDEDDFGAGSFSGSESRIEAMKQFKETHGSAQTAAV